MKKYVLALSIMSLFGASVIGCAPGEESKIEKTDLKKEDTLHNQEEVPVAAFPVTIKDALGREVVIEKEPERIVSSYYISSSLLIALDQKEKVVGLEMRANTRPIYKQAAPEFLELPALGNSKTFHLEECLQLNPDLVILPTRLKEYIPQLEALKVNVIAIEPETLEDFLETVEILARATGKEERGKELIAFHESVLEDSRALTENVATRPTVYLSGSDPYKTVTGQMYQSEMIECAGGENVSDELINDYWQTISPETLLQWNPEYIYAVSYASYELEDLLEDSKLQSVTAIRNQQVKTFPSQLEPWDYPTPSSALGILWLTSELHPELYSKEALEKTVDEFYTYFYGFTPDKEATGL